MATLVNTLDRREEGLLLMLVTQQALRHALGLPPGAPVPPEPDPADPATHRAVALFFGYVENARLN